MKENGKRAYSSYLALSAPFKLGGLDWTVDLGMVPWETTFYNGYTSAMQIYESYGYTTREAVTGIVQNNLYGLDIDDRAAQLAYFSVMMKARQYDRRFFSRRIQPNVYAIRESNGIHITKVVRTESGMAIMTLL